MKRKRFSIAIVCGVVALAMAAMLGLAGCGGSSSSSTASSTEQASSTASTDGTQLQIFAANSLEKALPEVQELYTQQHPEVTFADTQFKASGDLVQQLTADNNAADILICASASSMDQAADLIDESTRTTMFTNDLVVAAKKGSDIKIKSLDDLKDFDGTIAIGEPNTVPAGKYACQTLKSAGIITYDEDADGKISNIKTTKGAKCKIDAGSDKVGTVANHVSTGDFELGLVYTSDIYRYDGIEAIYTTPAKSHKNITYPGAVVKTSQNAETASDFLNFCTTDPDAQAIFTKYGFELASE